MELLAAFGMFSLIYAFYKIAIKVYSQFHQISEREATALFWEYIRNEVCETRAKAQSQGWADLLRMDGKAFEANFQCLRQLLGLFCVGNWGEFENNFQYSLVTERKPAPQDYEAIENMLAIRTKQILSDIPLPSGLYCVHTAGGCLVVKIAKNDVGLCENVSEIRHRSIEQIKETTPLKESWDK